MNWTTTTAATPEATTAAAQNSALKNALSGVSVPTSPAEQSEMQSNAASDQTRTELNKYKAVKQITVTPYTHGAFNGSKQSMAFYLSTTDAQAAVQSAASRSDWQACVLILINASSENNFQQQISALATVLPLPQITAAQRRAQATANNASEKLFVKAAEDKPVIAGKWRTYQHAENAAAIAEAIASDKPPADILNEYTTRRAQQINESATQPTGTINSALYLTGNISEQLKEITPPYPAAPLTAIFGWAGTVEEIAPIKAELNL